MGCLFSSRLHGFLEKAVVRTCQPGTKICEQGKKQRTLHLLLSGKASVVKNHQGQSRAIAILEENSVFGEVGYFLDEPRSADVVAHSECVVLCIPPHPAAKTLPEDRFKDLQMRIWFLQALHTTPFFKNIPTEALDQLLFEGVVKKVSPQSVLIREGELAQACYFVIQGSGSVTQAGTKINSVHKGSVIGEISLLFGDSRRTASIVADTELLIVELSLNSFWKVLSSQLALGLALEKLATSRLLRDQMRKAA